MTPTPLSAPFHLFADIQIKVSHITTMTSCTSIHHHNKGPVIIPFRTPISDLKAPISFLSRDNPPHNLITTPTIHNHPLTHFSEPPSAYARARNTTGQMRGGYSCCITCERRSRDTRRRRVSYTKATSPIAAFFVASGVFPVFFRPQVRRQKSV